MPNFQTFKDFLPLGCCGTCRRNLSYRFAEKPCPERYKPFPCEADTQFYQNVSDKLRKLPRGSGDNPACNCFICDPAHTDFRSVKSETRGTPKPEFSNETTRDNRSLDKSRVQDITEMMSTLTPRTKDALVHARIREKQAQEQKSQTDPLTFVGAVGGKPVEIIAGAKAKKKLVYDSKAPVPRSTFENMASATDISNRRAKINAAEFRKSQGVRSIEPGFAEGLRSEPKVIEKYFTTKYIDLEVMKDKVIVVERKKLVYCHDLLGYVNYIKEVRGIKPEIKVLQKVGVDGGGNFFKICLNIVVNEKTESDLRSPPKKKPSKSSDFKDGGVRKLLIIGIVQDIAETYGNAKIILNLLGIEKIDFVIATDYKLVNILLGLSSHSSKFRCPYCKVPFDDFCNPRRKVCQSLLRTLGDIRNWHRKYVEHCQWNYPTNPAKGKKDAMDFFNCIEEPLFNLPDETYIWDILPLFELHLRLGLINNLVTELNQKWSSCTGVPDPFWNFCDTNGIKKSTYRGNALEGPQTLILLEKLDLLERSIPRRFHGSDFVSVLRAFQVLHKSCMQMTLDQNWQSHLRDFKLRIERLNWKTGATKLHILMDHLEDFVLAKGPLGPFNEQASESVHHDWTATWDRYKKFANEDNLLVAVGTYNYRRT